jgi:hypothetical protein
MVAQVHYGHIHHLESLKKPQKKLTVGTAEFSARAFWILRKNPEEGETYILPSDSELWNRRLVPFVHHRIQRDLDENIIVAGSKRNIMLKPPLRFAP